MDGGWMALNGRSRPAGDGNVLRPAATSGTGVATAWGQRAEAIEDRLIVEVAGIARLPALRVVVAGSVVRVVSHKAKESSSRICSAAAAAAVR